MMPYSGVRPAGTVPYHLSSEIVSLRSARPTALSVEQPTRFEMVINLKTAKALGVTIPPSVLVWADYVIQ